MIEDNVTAWSKTLDEYVITHNVFREYAIEAKAFQMQPGDTEDFYAEWEVPTTMVIKDDNNDPQTVDIKVPVNPNNVIPVAVVYDDDDRSSGRGDGSENNDGDGGDGSPRALNSATPASTAYDLDNKPPFIEILEPTSDDGKIKINARIWDDGDELTAAFVIYREVGKKESLWEYRVLTIDGEECTDDVCAIGSGEASAVLPVSDSKSVQYSIAAYDGNWTKGNSVMSIASIDKDDDGISILMVGGVVIILAIIGALLFIRNSREGLEEESDGEEKYEDTDEFDLPDDESGETEGEGEEEEVFTWNEFRSLNKGKSKEEISELWKDYKEEH